MNLREVFESPVVQQFLRFSTVGVAATGVHYGILVALVEVFHVHTLLSTSLGFVAGALVSYSLNRIYTFTKSKFTWIKLTKYYGVTAIGMVLNGAIVAILLGWGIYYLLAQVIATGVVLISNFLSARWVVFRDTA